MPSAQEPSPPDFFAADDDAPENDLLFAPSVPTPPTAKKSKKKKGKRQDASNRTNTARAAEVVESEDVTPSTSPPKEGKEDGVRLQAGESNGEGEILLPELEEAGQEGGFEDVDIQEHVRQSERQHSSGHIASQGQVQEPEPQSTREQESKTIPSPVQQASAPLKSPRPAPARPASHAAAARTPPSRPASLYSPPPQQQHYSGGLGALNGNGLSPQRPPAPPLARRESATYTVKPPAATTSPRPRFVEPAAPPHKPQPHFYGIPSMPFMAQAKLDSSSTAGKPAGSDGYCCTFDSFVESGNAVSGRKAKDALLVGSEGALEVFRVLPNKFEVVGRLEGLRGPVVGAKVLPGIGEGTAELRPSVAVVVHGAMSADPAKDADGCYQTSVEVYSLQEQIHVATLYRSVTVAVEKPSRGQLAPTPRPVGDLTVDAHGKYVVVASGKSGEVFVFSHAATAENPEEQFRLLGKFWTSLQTSPQTSASSRPQSASGGLSGGEEKDERAGVPLFSLSPRWLAVMAPSTSAHVSIGGSPLLLDSNPLPPGLASHVAPPQPPVSCDIAGVDAEGTWSRVTRSAAQGLVKYSHIGFEMGRQGWRELTNPTPQTSGQHSRGASREHEAFPPTMAPADDPYKIVKEPAIVSIIDLDTLLQAEEVKPKYTAPPLSTFALEEGCNFLSLSSNGLRLLSVSRSGKVSMIWDLTQCCHGTARHVLSSSEDEALEQGPCVKQLHRFDRNSESVVVGATWSRDDDMLAVLTAHGTAHLHEVPLRASRKRKRRSTSTVAAPTAPTHSAEKAQPTVSVSQGMSPPSSSGWMGRLSSGLQSASSQVRARAPAPQTFSRPTFAGFRGVAANAGQVGGRMIAQGLSQGFTAAKGGVGDMWYSEDNKVRHKELAEGDGPAGRGGVRWVRKKEGSSLAVVCAGTVFLHPVELYTRRRGDEMVTGLRHDRYGMKKFTLPRIRTATEAGDCAREGVHGFWSLRTMPGESEGQGTGRGRRGSLDIRQPQPVQQAHEVETNPPYCPFHVDSRVGIYAFDAARADSRDADILSQGHGREDEEPWLFGEPLPRSTRLNTASHDVDGLAGAQPSGVGLRGGGGLAGGVDVVESDDEEGSLAAQMESRLTVVGEDEVRVHTTPKRGGGHMEEEEFADMGADGMDDF